MTVTIKTLVDPAVATLIVYGMGREDGTVVGSYFAPGQALAFEYNENGLAEFGTANIAYASQVHAYGISSNGQLLAGDAALPSAHTDIAVYWQNNLAYAVGDFSQTPSSLSAVNNKGDVGGALSLPDGNWMGFIQIAATHQLIELGSLNNAAPSNNDYSQATAINNLDQVVGYSVYASGNPTQHAFLWQNGVMQDLGTLAGFGSSAAFAINDAGQIVGDSSSQTASQEAVLWQNGKATDLGRLSSSGFSVANALNDVGQIVGESDGHAVLWQNGTITDLNTLLPANSGWVLTDAQGISNAGQITGNGTYNGVKTAYLLDLNETNTAAAAVQSFTGGVVNAIAVTDSAANVQANLDGLESIAAAGKLSGITLSDGGTPTISVTASQLSGDAAALAAISGNFDLSVSASSPNLTITGPAGHATTVTFSGTVGQYSFAAAGNGTSFTVSNGSSVDHLSGVEALQFSDATLIVAGRAPSAGGSVSAEMVTELYGAVFGRTPDVAGLSYYQTYAAANPTTPFSQYAQWFLSSGEYTGNSAHRYAETTAGDQQFIGDSYNNLLHRTPSASEISYYESNVIAPLLSGKTAGTAAYSAAELQAHALVAAYFSQSPEFLSDVQVTAQTPASAQHWLLLI